VDEDDLLVLVVEDVDVVVEVVPGRSFASRAYPRVACARTRSRRGDGA
jgi:hypothetical protein